MKQELDPGKLHPISIIELSELSNFGAECPKMLRTFDGTDIELRLKLEMEGIPRNYEGTGKDPRDAWNLSYEDYWDTLSEWSLT